MIAINNIKRKMFSEFTAFDKPYLCDLQSKSLIQAKTKQNKISKKGGRIDYIKGDQDSGWRDDSMVNSN